MLAPPPALQLTFEPPAFLASPVIHVARCDHPGSGLRLFFRIGGPGRQRRVEHRARSSMNNPRDSEALCIACVGARPVEGGALPGTRIAAGIVMGFMAGRPGQGLRTADGNSVAADSLHARAASAVPAAAA